MDAYESRRIDYLIDKLIDTEAQLKTIRKMYSDQQDLIRDLCSERDRYMNMHKELQEEVDRLTDSFGEGMMEEIDGRISAE